MHRTPIEWTTFAANPIKFRNAAGHVEWGCVHASEGCRHCYAETLAKRYGRGGPFTAQTMKGLTPFLDEKELRHMLTAQTVDGIPVAGSMCFVGDMTDVFGGWVDDDLLDQLFGVFALRPDVTWQVLTKRAARLRAYLTSRAVPGSFHVRLHAILSNADRPTSTPEFPWPLPNVWVGVSCENQAAADERIPDLTAAPAAVRFVSAEPLLGPINLHTAFCKYATCRIANAAQRYGPWCEPSGEIGWVIVGGESGPGARPCDIDDIQSIVNQCQDARVPVFVKQLGSKPWMDNNPSSARTKMPVRTEAEIAAAAAVFAKYVENCFSLPIKDRKGGDPNEWPADLRVREFPAVR